MEKSINAVKVHAADYFKDGVHLVQARKLPFPSASDVSDKKDKPDIDVIIPIKRFPIKAQVREVIKWIKENQVELFYLLGQYTKNKDGLGSAKGLMIIRIAWKGGVQEQRTVKLVD